MGQVLTTESQLAIFTLGETIYGVDVSQVREITELRDITAVPGSPYFVEGVTNLRGQVTTVIDLKKRFGLEEKKQDKDSRIIIVEPDGIPMGLIVDSVTEVLRLQTDAIESTPDLTDDSVTDYIKGIAKLADGALMIVVDIEQVVNGSENGGL
ncbi:MAG: chemotaxis protein CheW [Halobacteriota archaeon]|nr:chemotaxis protein CheW [Halobacteriota archaeon]